MYTFKTKLENELLPHDGNSEGRETAKEINLFTNIRGTTTDIITAKLYF